MSIAKPLELNKRYTWRELMEACPHMYVFLADEIDDESGWIESAVLLAVCDYDGDVGATLKKVDAMGKKFTVQKTVYEDPMTIMSHYRLP